MILYMETEEDHILAPSQIAPRNETEWNSNKQAIQHPTTPLAIPPLGNQSLF